MAVKYPLGYLGIVEGKLIKLTGLVASLDGQKVIRASGEGEDPELLGGQVAAKLIQQGAQEILKKIRNCAGS